VYRARTEAGLSQRALADQLGIERTHLSRLESGAKSPSYQLLLNLAGVLNLDLNALKPTAS
jgi:transcriptional regulator with XRE-family HTH domain